MKPKNKNLAKKIGELMSGQKPYKSTTKVGDVISSARANRGANLEARQGATMSRQENKTTRKSIKQESKTARQSMRQQSKSMRQSARQENKTKRTAARLEVKMKKGSY